MDMTRAFTDSVGNPVTIEIAPADLITAYVVKLADGTVVGHADFVSPPGDATERIFFHTEVQAEFGGRGLARLLVSVALEDSIRDEITIVPVCPLFARHLSQRGDEFVAAGGRFRAPARADTAEVDRALREPR